MSLATAGEFTPLHGFDFDLAGLQHAAQVVGKVLTPTAQICWPLLCQRTGAEVWVKHENHLPTGAFKIRGGLVLLDSLRRGLLGPKPLGIITASVGNHGLSQALAGRRAGFQVTIVVPTDNNPEKNESLRAEGAELLEIGRDFSAAYAAAKQLAAERQLYFIESFHPELVRGVATAALEFFTAAPDLDIVYVPVGMGSGICALIRVRDLLGLPTRIVGVVSKRAPAFALSFEAGRVVPTETAFTMAEGIAVRVPDTTAVEIARRGAERIVEVGDEQIAAAIRAYHEDTHNLAEGAGAAPLAALIAERDAMRGRRVGLMLTGANIPRPMLAEILSAWGD